jgi:hypothetical protein
VGEIETVTISDDGMASVTITSDELFGAAEKVQRAARQTKGGPPRTTVERIMEDVAQILEESMPPLYASIDATEYELPASIAIKIAFVPAKPGTETKIGEPAQVVVSGKLALPTTKHEHDAQASSGQLSLL